MKTFTVTYHHTCNYGAILQTYALQTKIKELGHENSVFEYKTDSRFYSPIDCKKPTTIPKVMYINFLKWFRRDKLRKLNRSFDTFRNNRLALSDTYESMEQLRNNAPKADVYIVGSDQVWRFLNPEFLPARFLDFGDIKTKRISYAASLEKLNYSDDQKKLVREYLSRFSAISLREESSRNYIQEIIGKQVERVIDPVFLLSKEEWSTIATKPRIDEPYIVCYQVQSNNRMQEVVDTLKRRTGYKTVAINNSEVKWIKTDYSFFDVSPEEFLGFYLNANVIVSASFHGSALGILFGKPTYGLIKESGKNRIYEIFKLFHLDEYCIGEHSVIPELDYDKEAVNRLIKEEKHKAIAYLETNLNETIGTL